MPTLHEGGDRRVTSAGGLVTVRRRYDFDPHEPRDRKGRWTGIGARPSVGGIVQSGPRVKAPQPPAEQIILTKDTPAYRKASEKALAESRQIIADLSEMTDTEPPNLLVKLAQSKVARATGRFPVAHYERKGMQVILPGPEGWTPRLEKGRIVVKLPGVPHMTLEEAVVHEFQHYLDDLEGRDREPGKIHSPEFYVRLAALEERYKAWRA